MKNVKPRLFVGLGGLRGLEVLKDLVEGALHEKYNIVGSSLDYVPNRSCSASRRYWRYKEFREHETELVSYAARHGIPLFANSIKRGFTGWFEDLSPQILLVVSHGQRFRRKHLKRVRVKLNFHPIAAGSKWLRSPYAGPKPYETMVARGDTAAEIIAHVVTGRFDGGKEVMRSQSAPLPKMSPGGMGRLVYEMHRRLAPITVELLRALTPRILLAVRNNVDITDLP